MKRVRLHDGIPAPSKPPISVNRHMAVLEYIAKYKLLSKVLTIFSVHEVLCALDIMEHYGVQTNTLWYEQFKRDLEQYMKEHKQ